MFEKTIIALATPPLHSALALIRVSGKDAFAITNSLFSRQISSESGRAIYYGMLFDNDRNPIDLVVILAYPEPNTMTGENVIEISCHGSQVIVNQIIEAYLSKGAVYATRGEFSSRAFYNGKMDLIEAEAVNDLISATTKEAKNLALLSVSGETSKLVLPLKDEVASLLAFLEVGIDFPEYDEEEEISHERILLTCKETRHRIASLIKQGQQGKLYRDGVKIALVGAPNVGKSSLLNALLKQNKAIVSEIPGTTRDVVEGAISIDGIPVQLLDTAGIHETNDRLEQMGVDRSKMAIEEADLVLFIHDASINDVQEEKELLSLLEGKDVIHVYNKMDLLDSYSKERIYITANEGKIDALIKAVKAHLGIEENAYRLPSLSSARELGLLRQIDEALMKAQEDAEQGCTLDLISVSLQEAYRLIRMLLGEEPSQDLEDEIFSRFCVGK